MFISKIRAKNFRHLKDSTLTIDDKDKHQLSLLIGRNNSGKTSFLVLLEKFYAGKQFDFYDFPVSLRDDLLAFNQDSDTNKLAIQLFIEIQYTKEDSLDNLSSFILDLEPDIFQANIFFECTVNKKRLLDALDKITTSKEKFINNNISNYLESKVYTFENDEDLKAENRGQNLILRDIKDVRKLINLHIIHAKRNVSSSDSDVGKGTVLSKLSMDFYNGESEGKVSELNVINQSIADLDDKLNETYKSFFDSFLKKAKNVLGLENLCVVSDLESKQIVSNYSKVVHGDKAHALPESLSGLGYLNILYLLLQIEIIERVYASDIKEINLLIIEEPEAHTHPQMQYVFIKEIKKIIANIPTLQVLLTTHSSHIVSQCDFHSIRYFKIDEADQNIKIKNFYNELKQKYKTEKKQFKFLTQYLTLYAAELFFAEKVILIEGDTERLLLPLFIRQFDQGNEKDNQRPSSEGKDPANVTNPEEPLLPLGAQNISIVEAGTNAKAFSHFLTFFDIKTLIITDIDTVRLKKPTELKKDEKNTREFTCAVNDDPENTSNETLKHYLIAPDRPELVNRTDETDKEQAFQKWLKNLIDGKLESPNKNIKIAYQQAIFPEKGKTYHARSFEDAFIFENLAKIKKHKDSIEGLQNKTRLDEAEISNNSDYYYKLTNDIIKSKTAFASSLLYLALTQDDISWTIPHYIKEGLKWIQN